MADNMINVHVTDLEGITHTIEAPLDMNMSLMEAIRANELQIKATCGGMAICATCHVIVKSDHQLNPMSDDEEAMLDEAFLLDIPNSRLSCQLHLTPEMDGLEVQLGPGTGA
jgi:2Fe-2S ferredoxin